jgi:hypothetical protein
MNIVLSTCASTTELPAAVAPMWHSFGRVPVDEQVAALQAWLPSGASMQM